MKYKINKKTEKLTELLDPDYKKLYDALIENIQDEEYTRSEINYFIRKSVRSIITAQEKKTAVEEFAHHNVKKWAIDENKKYRDWHKDYLEKMKQCDRVTYAGFFSMVAYSITLITVTAFTKGALSTWLWILLPGLITVALMLTKILFARRLKLSKLHTFGDIIMFLLVTGICYFSTIYFIIFLWVYEVAFMVFLQIHIVEEDI